MNYPQFWRSGVQARRGCILHSGTLRAGRERSLDCILAGRRHWEESVSKCIQAVGRTGVPLLADLGLGHMALSTVGQLTSSDQYEGFSPVCDIEPYTM